MRTFYLFCCLILALGCGVGEQPLAPTEDEADLEVEDAIGPAPEGEQPTVIVTVGQPVSRIQTFTRVGLPTQTFVIIDGELTERIVFFQDESYYHLIPIREIDGEWIEDGRTVVLNVLDQKIVPVERRNDAGGIVTLDTPIHSRDELEVVIKDRFTYIKEHITLPAQPVNGLIREKKTEIEIEMIFAEIKRNLTRPDWDDVF